MDKGYLDLNGFFKEKFGEKVHKIALTLNATCPNRDGTLSTKGCLFCNEKGSGDFISTGDLHEQVFSQIARVKLKFPNAKKFVAYFQNFSNTYGDVEYLEKCYMSLLEFEEIVAISIGTRADCLSKDILEVLVRLREMRYIYVELGLQTIHEKSREFLNIGYPLSEFQKGLEALQFSGIDVVAHLIFGIPGESVEEMLKSVEYLVKQSIWGVKFHHFYVSESTGIEKYYKESQFHLLTVEEYMQVLLASIKIIGKNCIVHRMSSDPDKKSLIAPIWTISKIEFLNQFHKGLRIEISKKNY